MPTMRAASRRRRPAIFAVNGLYFSPVTSLSGLLVASQSIKVGLSAQGYPFVAPSGIVDQSLRLPGEEAGASVLVNFDTRGTVGAELDASLPLAPTLALGIGLNAGQPLMATAPTTISTPRR